MWFWGLNMMISDGSRAYKKHSTDFCLSNAKIRIYFEEKREYVEKHMDTHR